MNLFVAIFPDFAGPISETLSSVWTSDRVDRFRFVRPEKRHITVLFIGDHDEESCNRAREVFLSWQPPLSSPSELTIRHDRFGPFPPSRRSRVLAFYGTSEPPPALLLLHHQLTDLYAPFSPDRRRFRPHLTVAYPRGRTTLGEIQPVSVTPLELVARELSLVVTRTDARGSLYEIRASVSVLG